MSEISLNCLEYINRLNMTEQIAKLQNLNTKLIIFLFSAWIWNMVTVCKIEQPQILTALVSKILIKTTY